MLPYFYLLVEQMSGPNVTQMLRHIFVCHTKVTALGRDDGPKNECLIKVINVIKIIISKSTNDQKKIFIQNLPRGVRLEN